MFDQSDVIEFHHEFCKHYKPEYPLLGRLLRIERNADGKHLDAAPYGLLWDKLDLLCGDWLSVNQPVAQRAANSAPFIAPADAL